MKVLHIFREKSFGKVGGVENHIKYLTREQVKQGLTPSVLTFVLSDKNHLEIKRKDGVDWYYIQIKTPLKKLSEWSKSFQGEKFGLFFISFERLYHNFHISAKSKIIEQINPDIIHQHDYLSSVRLSRKISKKKTIIFTNHYGEYLFLDKNVLTRILQDYFMNRFNAIIASSNNLLPTKKNSYLIPNGFDTVLFNKVSAEKKQELKIEYGFKDKVVFLCARRWAPNKGVIYLAKAICLLNEDIRQKCVFLFAGNNSDDYDLYKDQVHEVLKKCDSANIHLYGNLDHNKLSALIAVSDVGVIPSLVEGLSLYSIELISSGVPVLATNIGGLPEVVKNNETGWLVPPKSAESLANEISRIALNGPETNIKIDIDGFREKYSWKSIAEQTLKIYKQYYI